MRGISLAVAITLIVAAALAAYAIAYFGKLVPKEPAKPVEAISFAIRACSAGAGIARLYDSGSTLISGNITIPQVPPGETSPMRVQGLVAGMEYYLEYPGTAPRLFSCAA